MAEEKKDLIFLDAKLTDQVSVRAFRAELANGHTFIAYARVDFPHALQPGGRVKVCLSPFDMSVGRIVGEEMK